MHIYVHIYFYLSISVHIHAYVHIYIFIPLYICINIGRISFSSLNNILIYRKTDRNICIYTHTRSLLKKNFPFATTQIKMEDIMLSEKNSDTERKDTAWSQSCGIKKKVS